MSEITVMGQSPTVTVLERGGIIATVGAIGPPGSPGPMGPAGPPATSYIHSQLTPSSSWIIPHNLSKYPSVTILDSAGTQIAFPDLSYPNANTVLLGFDFSFSGTAYLN